MMSKKSKSESKPIRFTVDGHTISKSNSYRIAGSRMYKTKMCAQWERVVSGIASMAPDCPQEPSSGSIYIEARFYFQDGRRRDIDGPLKSLLDAMNGVIYNDDSQIVKLVVEKFIDRQNPRTEVEIIILED